MTNFLAFSRRIQWFTHMGSERTLKHTGFEIYKNPWPGHLMMDTSDSKRSMHVCNWQGILTHESEVNVTTESRCGNRSSSRNSPWVRRNLQIHNISLEFRVRLQGSWSWMFVLISSTPVFTIQHSITSNGPSYELGPLPAGLDILPALSEKWKGFVILER